MATRKKATTTETTEEVTETVGSGAKPKKDTQEVKVPKTNLKVARGTNVKSICR